MRNHIIFKFLAVALCAAALLSAVAGGVGIFVMTESGLYEKNVKNVDELYHEQLESYALNYGISRWEMYASQELGGASEELAKSFYRNWYRYNTFRPDRVGFTVRDGEGNAVLEEPLSEGVDVKYSYEFPADYPFLKVLSEVPYVEEMPTEATMPPEVHTTHIDDMYVYDAIPEVGAEVYFLNVRYEDGSEMGMESTDSPLGMLRRLDDGAVVMDPVEDMGHTDWDKRAVWILFMDEDRNILYEASSAEGVVEETRWQETVGLFLRLRKLTEDVSVMDAVPPEGCSVKRVSVTYEDGTGESAGGTPDIGILEYNEHGGIRFTANDAHLLLEQGGKIVHIAFYDENETLVYEARNPEGVGYLYTFDNKQIFITEAPPEVLETIPEVTAPSVTMPVHNEETDPSVGATEEVLVPEEKTGEIFHYYSNAAQQRMDVVYTLESLPGYTMTVELAAKPLQHEGDWVLTRTLYAYRNWLPLLLGAGLLLFAVTAVYLCCAAGRKPKSDTVRPGGLNCIPLDMYLAMTGFGVVGLAFLAVEAIPEIMGELRVMLVVGGLLAYAASLLVVGFCFACAAQFKTPGGYWWRHSVCGFLLKLAGKVCGLLLRILRWIWRFWREKLWPGIKALIVGIFTLAMGLLKKIGGWLKKTGKSAGKKMNRFYSLLPVTWQWMLCGSALVLVIFLAAESRRAKWMLLSLLIGFGLILYGAHCFGLLLESAKGMSKGNLEEKVDDKLMTGSFKEFAGELNGLADVAVVAAQKQLKSERMKTELITNVSHDIKTPLTSIINYVDLLQKPHTEQEQEKYLEVLDRQSQRLKKLVEDLMEMSKASTGNLAVEIGRVDAVEAVNQALGEFADKLEKAQLYPVFRQPEKPVYMLADGRLVWRVMSNLLSNVVKYALPGTRLYVDLQKLENKMILSLKNISREELNVQADELLERFVRGDASRNTEGSGLGLNIARSLMELQKGQLQILVDGDLFKVTLIFPAEE